MGNHEAPEKLILALSIRRLTPGTINGLASLVESGDGPQMAFLCSWVSQQPSFLYAGLINESVVGFAAYTLLAPEAELIDIRLEAGCRGRGYGRELLSYTLQEIFELGAETVLLEVRASNLAAQNLYASSGFVEYGVRRNYYHATNGAEDAILMRLDNSGSHRA